MRIFFTVIKGAPAARQPSGPAGRIGRRGAKPSGKCVAAPHAGQFTRTRRPVAQALTIPGDRACVSDWAVLLAPGILSPCKDHRQGRTSSLRCGRSTLTLIFPGKTRHLSGGRGRCRRSDCVCYLRKSCS